MSLRSAVVRPGHDECCAAHTRTSSVRSSSSRRRATACVFFNSAALLPLLLLAAALLMQGHATWGRGARAACRVRDVGGGVDLVD